jgi:hypothetical protein
MILHLNLLFTTYVKLVLLLTRFDEFILALGMIAHNMAV